LLGSWSDKKIKAQETVSPYLDAFQKIGFTLQESRMRIIRPTQSFNIDWPSDWPAESLKIDQLEEIAALFQKSFSGAVDKFG
jgi:hypothetical protein